MGARKAAAWTVAWSLYWLGDSVSRFMDYWPWETLHPYFLYNRLMNWSSDVQDWGDASGPWLPPNPAPQENRDG